MIHLKHRYEEIDDTIASRMKKLRTDFQLAFNISPENQLQEHGVNRYTQEKSRPDNIRSKKDNNKWGTSTDYILKRLYRDRKDLYDKVLAGQISATKAAEHAGFRKRSVHLTKCTRRPVPQDAGRCLFPHESSTNEGFVVGIPDRHTDVKKNSSR